MSTAVKHTDSELIAKRWAKALMDLASETQGISKDDILDDLKEISELIESSEELKNVVNNPSISINEKQIVLCKLFQNQIMPIVYNFIFALNLKKRLNLIDVIAEEFQKEIEAEKNILRVGVVSAIDLSEERKLEIRNKIAEKLHKDVIVTWNVDVDIIAGLIFRIGETVIDNSIRHKLENLSKNIIKG